MSPEFASAFDPALLEVLDLLDRVATGTAADPETEKAKIRGAVDRAASRVSGSRGRDWELASYALVALVDELLIADLPWAGQSWWENHALEVDLFHTRNRATAFFERAEQAMGLPSRDALEAFIAAVLLGFRGMVRGQHEAMEAWLRRQEQLVKIGVGRSPVADATVELSGGAPLLGRVRLVWASLAAALAAACVVVAIWGFAVQ